MTDRTLRSTTDLDALAFDADGLIPVVAQDAADGRVLMVAWATREALARSLATGDLHFWSRSRRTLWRKGETSGNTLAVRSLHADCDADTVLARVTPAGPACHTGEPTCFGAGATPSGTSSDPASATGDDTMAALSDVLDDRARRRPSGSYTTRLLSDENLRLKKLGEETAELVSALAREDSERATEEAADLIFHAVVALRAVGVRWHDVRAVLDGRRRD